MFGSRPALLCVSSSGIKYIYHKIPIVLNKGVTMVQKATVAYNNLPVPQGPKHACSPAWLCWKGLQIIGGQDTNWAIYVAPQHLPINKQWRCNILKMVDMISMMSIWHFALFLFMSIGTKSKHQYYTTTNVAMWEMESQLTKEDSMHNSRV